MSKDNGSVPALEARGLSKAFPGGVEALVDIDLRVEPQQTVALVGGSGSGKTTLLRLFNRMLEPTRGEVLVGGQPATDRPAFEQRRHMGYVPQNGGLLPHWCVRRNVEMVPALLRWDAERRSAASTRLLELVGLPARRFAERYPAELSGGERQRVALARALAADPPILLMDEPFGALDAITRRELQQEFGDLQKRLGKTVVLVTHDIAEAELLAERIAVLHSGHLLQIASADQLRRAPHDDYVARLVGSARGDIS